MAGSEFVLKMISGPEVLRTVARKAAALLGRPIQAKAELQRSGMTGGRDRLDDVIARSGPLGDRLTLK